MKVDDLKYRLSDIGWKDIAPGRYMGIDFDIIGSRRFLFTKWTVLVKRINSLDRDEIAKWQTLFQTFSEKSKSWWVGKCFLLCLLVDHVSGDLLDLLTAKDSFGLLGAVRMKGGGGNILIANLEGRSVYGAVPTLPYDVHKFSKDLKDVIDKVLSAPA